MTERLLKVSEVAAELNVSKMTVYRLTESGALRSMRIGRSIRVSAYDLADYKAKAVQ